MFFKEEMSFIKVAKTSEIPLGKMKAIKINDTEVLIANVGGKYYAMANRYTHRNGDLSKGSLEGSTVTCPLHGAKFDVATGKAISGPKIAFLNVKINDEPTFEVKVEGDDVMLNVS